MTVVVAGTLRVPVANLPDLKPHMLTMIAATRGEDGCVDYSYAEDIAEPGVIRVAEVWRDKDALKAHFTMPHMAAWRAAGEKFGVSDRRLTLYDISREKLL
jgi:quinol monooxygenase YgiN